MGHWLDYIGIGSVILVGLYAAFSMARAIFAATQNSPYWRNWWQDKGENATIDAAAWIIGLVLSGSAIAWREYLGANLYAVGALNTGVALLIRASVPTLWVWTTWMAWRLQFTEDASEPMKKIEANRIVPALSRGIIAAALISTLLTGNEVKPDWLGKWWVITIATTFGCNWTTKIESTFQPMALWHKFTKDKYKS